MLAALFLTWFQVGEPCAACSTAGKEVRVCAPHAEEERKVFASAGRSLSSRDSAERIAGLEELARLTFTHVNAPSKRLAERLASALDDDSLEVRKRAAELLGPPQNAVVAMGALLGAFKASEGERDKVQKRQQRLVERQRGPQSPDGKKLKELKLEEGECARQLEALVGWRSVLLGQLVRFPDERVVDAILKEPRGFDFGGNEALAQLGTQRAWTGVVASIGAWEQELIGWESMLRNMEGAVSGYSKDLQDAFLGVFREQVEKVRAAGAAHLPELARLAREHQLGPTPERNERRHEEWERWLANNRAAMLEKLPGVNSPVW
jgi:hypothetical protein